MLEQLCTQELLALTPALTLGWLWRGPGAVDVLQAKSCPGVPGCHIELRPSGVFLN